MKNFKEFLNENIDTMKKIDEFLKKWSSEYIIYEDLNRQVINKDYDKDLEDLRPIEIEVVDYDYCYEINFWDDQKLLKKIEIAKNEENINHYLKKYNVKLPHYTEY